MLRAPKLNRIETGISEPPRSVPLSVRLRVLFGGFSSQFGWLFFGFGMLFVWFFGGTAALYDLTFMSGKLAEAEGSITAIEATNTTINERRLYEYKYEFLVDGVSYNGSSDEFFDKFKEDETVPVEYSVTDPTRSRLKGIDTYQIFMLIPMVFVAVGLGFVFAGIRKGIKGIRLLRIGKKTMGVLISKEPTNSQVNKRRVYKFLFRFRADNGQTCEVIAKTHETGLFEGEIDESTQGVSDGMGMGGIKEPLLYNPHTPKDAVLLDDLPGAPRFDERGEIKGNPFGVIPRLFIPLITMGSHTCWALHVMEIL